jgi:hypothetical protein
MRTRRIIGVAASIALAAATATPAAAQNAAQGAVRNAGDLAARVHAAPDGKVRFSYRVRPDVCGDGNSISTNDGRRASSDVESTCEHGPGRVVLDVRGHAITGLRTYVGGRWRSDAVATDLGDVSPQVAADYLLSLAHDPQSSVAKRAIFPASIADGVTVWPTLMKIARDDGYQRDVRRDAVFWLGQLAGNAATAGLAELAASDTVDRAVRESAVFALSQQHDAGVPELIHIARTNRDPEIRRKAIFWLGQSNDPRALALFEDLLAKGKS